MKKLKVYQYADTPEDVYELSGYHNCVPFTKYGIERWCELVEPRDAELFLGGQYHDRNSWMLEPERFEFFKGNEHRHYFDIEGDWAGKRIPSWLHPCILSAMNAEPNHRNQNMFVRPACSNLLMSLVKEPSIFTPPEQVGFFFMGQPDPNGLRQKVRKAFELSGVPGEFIFTNKWNAPSQLDDSDVLRYIDGMKRWSFQLCPAGTGQMTVRFFEACAYGRLPIVIADNLLFSESSINFVVRQDVNTRMEVLARWFRRIYELLKEREPPHDPIHFFRRMIKPYFDDPTAWLIARLHKTGLLED